MPVNNDRVYLLKAADGPESIEIYTSDHEGVSNWSQDSPAMFLSATTMDCLVHLGPFHLATVREQVEKAVGAGNELAGSLYQAERMVLACAAKWATGAATQTNLEKLLKATTAYMKKLEEEKA